MERQPYEPAFLYHNTTCIGCTRALGARCVVIVCDCFSLWKVEIDLSSNYNEITYFPITILLFHTCLPVGSD